MLSLFSRLAALSCCFALLACGSQARAAVVAKAVGAVIANDMNVNSFVIGIPADSAPVAASGYYVDFASGGDGFGFSARDGGNEGEDVVDGDSPFAQLDDSMTFAADTAGVIVTGDFDNYFGSTDTVDTNSPVGGTYTATWEFNIAGATGDLAVSVDAAAMGDFEDADVFDFEYSLDGGANFSPLFTSEFDDTEGFYEFVSGGSNIDLTVDGQDPSELPAEIVYQLESGTFIGWKDPMKLNGEFLNNEFKTITQGIGATESTTLQVRFSSITNGGTEAFVFRNLTVEDNFATTTLAGDYNGDGSVDAADYTVWRDGGPLQNETVTLGVIDAADYTEWASNFGNETPSATAVPEPAAVLLLMIGLAGLTTRRNG